MVQPDVKQFNINEITLGPKLTQEQAKKIFDLGEGAVIFALLRLAKMADPTTEAVFID